MKITKTSAISAFASAPAAKVGAVVRVEPIISGVAVALSLPERAKKTRGSTSNYPFDQLEVGTAFGIKNKSAKNLASVVNNQNRKSRVAVLDAAGQPTFETKTLTGADGTATIVPDTSKPITAESKHFYAVDVDADVKALIKGTALEGSSVLVYRDK